MKRSSPLAYAFFFIATLIGLGALFFFCEELRLPKGWITAALALATAEWLIRRHGFESTGVESALWLGGLFAFIAGLPSTGKPEAILAFAAASAIAGWRVRNPWFGALAAVLVLYYLREKGVSPTAAAQVTAIAAALLRARTWRLASTDRLFGAIAIASAAAGFSRPAEAGRYTDGILCLIGGAILLGIALRLRDRMLLIAAAVSVALGSIALHDFFDYPAEGKLVAGGIALVAISLIVSRALRGKTSGIVATPGPDRKYQEAVTLVATVLAQPQHAPASNDSARFEGGGGDGGGGGATESY